MYLNENQEKKKAFLFKKNSFTECLLKQLT